VPLYGHHQEKYLQSRQHACLRTCVCVSACMRVSSCVQTGIAVCFNSDSCIFLLMNYLLFFFLFFRKTMRTMHISNIFISISLQLLVLKYVQNKDVFMRYHKAHLTRRLILDTSADSEKEENMVEWWVWKKEMYSKIIDRVSVWKCENQNWTVKWKDFISKVYCFIPVNFFFFILGIYTRVVHKIRVPMIFHNEKHVYWHWIIQFWKA
jgi:hypothetical protein